MMRVLSLSALTISLQLQVGKLQFFVVGWSGRLAARRSRCHYHFATPSRATTNFVSGILLALVLGGGDHDRDH